MAAGCNLHASALIVRLQWRPTGVRWAAARRPWTAYKRAARCSRCAAPAGDGRRR